MGAETEYGLSAQRDGAALDPDSVYERLIGAVKAMRAWVPDHHGYRGVYLEHGGRLYLDYGSHPEHATPECHTPRQVALYDKAGEHLLRLARDVVMTREPRLLVRILKNNLDPVEPEETTYGTHESYTCWAPSEQVCPQLVPHLVSRVLYCGAGALTGHAGGVGFELSQRARHLHVVESDDTTGNRAIFSTRIRKVTDGGGEWTRVHLIGKDSQRSPFGIYLTYAVTGLLIDMINRGLVVGQGLALADPVRALRAFSLDPWARTQARLVDGRRLTAVQIQAEYLEQCEQALQQGRLPDWAGEAIGHWRGTLAVLEKDPLRLADRLDPYCKLLLCEHELLRAGLDWGDLRRALEKLDRLHDVFTDRVTRAVLDDSDAGLAGQEREQFVEARASVEAGKPGVLDRLRFANRLRVIDLQYHELGGLYDRLHDAGKMKDVILTPADVDEASRTPPPGGRAAVRGAWIRAHREPDWRGDWQYVWQSSSRRCIDLRDPFSGKEQVVSLTVPPDQEPYEVDVLDLLRTPAMSA
jgi:proteasome accessory factor A